MRALASLKCGPGSISRLGVTCGVNLSIFYPGPRFSDVLKLYGPFSGVTIPFVSQERTGCKSSNFTDIFLFVA